MKNNCLNCGKEFDVSESQIKNNRGKFCCKKCKYEYVSTRKINNCKICNKETKNEQFCSIECRDISFGKIIKQCPICNTNFSNNRNIYCSKTCYTEYQNSSEIKEKLKEKEKRICLICGSEHYNKKYCSIDCQHKAYRIEKIDRIKVICNECGIEFLALPLEIKKGRDKFCSNICKHKNKKISYLGPKNPMYGFKMSDFNKEQHSKIMIELWKDPIYVQKIKDGIEKFYLNNDNYIGWNKDSIIKRENTNLEKFGFKNCWSSKEIRLKCENTCIEKYGKTSTELAYDGLLKKGKTSIEIIFETYLKENNINYISQFYISYFKDKKRFKIYDFFLFEYNLLIEIDGDYWHGNPIFFKKLNEAQIKNADNDNFKNILAKSKGYDIFRIWEYEIKNNTFIDKLKNKLYDKNKNN